MAPVLSNEFLYIQATIERGFVLKRVRDIRIKNMQSQEFKIVFTVTLVAIFTLEEIVSSKAKGRISKRVLQENKARQIFWKRNISYPHMYVSVGKKCSFFGQFGVLCLLVTPVLRFARFVITHETSPLIISWMIR